MKFASGVPTRFILRSLHLNADSMFPGYHYHTDIPPLLNFPYSKFFGIDEYYVARLVRAHESPDENSAVVDDYTKHTLQEIAYASDSLRL